MHFRQRQLVLTASNWIRFFLLGSDPGLTQTKQAAKTVLAVGLTLFLFWNAPPTIRLYAGMCAGFLMQCTAGKTRREKQLCLVTMVGATAVTAGVENSLGIYALPKGILLIGVAFAVYYVRQFIPGKAGFPLFGFTLSLIASIHPEDGARGLLHSLAVLSGGTAAYLVYFYVLPDETSGTFRHALRLFTYRSNLLIENPTEFKHLPVLRNAVLFNQEETNRLCRLFPDCQRFMSDQYEMLQVLTILVDLALEQRGDAAWESAIQYCRARAIQLEQALERDQSMIGRRSD